MKVITFSNLKGGTGKTSLAIITANILQANGYKVLVIDSDIQNSMTFYYCDETETESKNLANVFFGKPASDNIINIKPGIDLIASHLALNDFFAVSRLNIIKNTLTGLSYDFVIIDTPPTFNNILVNAWNASDVIIIPCHLSQFDYKTIEFSINQFKLNEIKAEYKILLNRFTPARSGNEDNLTNQYLNLFNQSFNGAILPATIPDSIYLKRYIDTKEIISKAKAKGKLFTAINDFIFEIVNIKNQMELF